MKKKTALITGVAGMDGSHLADFLLEKDYNVVGVIRRNATRDLGNAKHLENKIDLIEGDITDMSSMLKIISNVSPQEIYNLAAMSVHPETIINVHRIGPGSYTKPIKIEELWNSGRIFKRNIIKQKHMTEGGEVDIEIINLETNKSLMVLGYISGMGEWFPIKQISRHYYKGKLIRLRQKWGEVIVTPNHSVYNSKGQLVKPTENPELLAMRKINYFNKFPKTSVVLKLFDTDIRNPNPIGIDIDNWMYLSDEQNKKVKKVLSLEDGTLQPFLRFCGAFIAEGWTSYNKCNKSFETGIAQNNKNWLLELQKDLNVFYDGPSCIVENKKKKYDSTFALQISSKILYFIMRKYCGVYSINKQIPDFFLKLPKSVWPELLSKLHEGDGSLNECKNYDNIKYASTSKKLIAQLCYIYSLLNIDYNYSYYKFANENWHDKFELRQVGYFKKNNGDKFYEEIDYEGYVYDISVDEVNNFCAGLGNIVVHNSHVATSFEQPIATVNIDLISVINILEVVRYVRQQTRIFTASTSEMFGSSPPPQGLDTPFIPQSPYAIAKLAAHHFIRLYRESYKMFCCAGITFNHTGERRGPNFVSRKISMGVAKCLKEPEFRLKLGNLDSTRDFGLSSEFIQGFWLTLQQEKPNDFIFATGKSFSIRHLCKLAFEYVGLDYEKYIEIDRFFMRPSEVPDLRGVFEKTKELLGWEPKVEFEQIVKLMVDNDCRLLGLIGPDETAENLAQRLEKK